MASQSLRFGRSDDEIENMSQTQVERDASYVLTL
jgi:hypothetical protein